MRKTLMFAVLAAGLCGGSLSASAASLASPGLNAAAGQLSGIETVARVCRERCSHGVCKKTCRSDNSGYERRHHRHWEERRHRHRHHDRGPGIRFEVR
jgi:hypothetical protein